MGHQNPSSMIAMPDLIAVACVFSTNIKDKVVMTGSQYGAERIIPSGIPGFTLNVC